jgi:alpha-D-xyloside xylohydrolase
MNSKPILLFFLLLLTVTCKNDKQVDVTQSEVAPGIYKLSSGDKEDFTPYNLCAKEADIKALEKIKEGEIPFSLDEIILRKTERGYSVTIPLSDKEQLYGFGLQIGSFQQRGLKKKPIVNDNPLNTLGYTHAPQPFYISSKGYGIIINTARYTTFHCGTNKKKKTNTSTANKENDAIETKEKNLYSDFVFVDIPNAKGIEVFVIKAVDIKTVVEKYNLFSGGGALPPIWGLGLKYRTKGNFDEEQVQKIADYFLESQIPCDVIGLEWGWQTFAYPCSYSWNNKRFPVPRDMVANLKEKGFRVNLGESAYVHHASPIYKDLYNYSADFLVRDGLVPDFTLSETRKIFGDYHEKIIEEGISGFSLDKSDNSNISSGYDNWGFPDMSVFPSGIDGERMRQLFGSLYVKTIDDLFRKNNIRTYQDYSSSGLFMSSVPATLYSSIHGNKDYIQMICNSAFSGLLWSPELRDWKPKEEFFHRLQTVLLSAQAVVNNWSWNLKNPPWLQYEKDENNQDISLTDKQEMEKNVRSLIDMRMQLVPYLYASFAKYYQEGIPPFRPLVMDYPDDEKVRNMDNQYMVGSNIMAAPLYEEGDKRKVYFPNGEWYNFYTNEKYEGGKEYEIKTEFSQLPIYIQSGSILPLAKPVQNISDKTIFEITCNVYGDNPADFVLFEDDGTSYNYEKGLFNFVTLSVKNGKCDVIRNGKYNGIRFTIKDNWNFIK